MMREREYLYANRWDKCLVGQKMVICLNGTQFFLFFAWLLYYHGICKETEATKIRSHF